MKKRNIITFILSVIICCSVFFGTCYAESSVPPVNQATVSQSQNTEQITSAPEGTVSNQTESADSAVKTSATATKGAGIFGYSSLFLGGIGLIVVGIIGIIIFIILNVHSKHSSNTKDTEEYEEYEEVEEIEQPKSQRKRSKNDVSGDKIYSDINSSSDGRQHKENYNNYIEKKVPAEPVTVHARHESAQEDEHYTPQPKQNKPKQNDNFDWDSFLNNNRQ